MPLKFIVKNFHTQIEKKRKKIHPQRKRKNNDFSHKNKLDNWSWMKREVVERERGNCVKKVIKIIIGTKMFVVDLKNQENIGFLGF
jgi:hypothetical protein